MELRAALDAGIVSHADVAEVLDVVQHLGTPRPLVDVIARVRRAARVLSGADGITFVLREGAQVHYADEEAIGPLWKGCRFPIESCVSGLAIMSAAPIVIDDIFDDARVPLALYRPTFVRSLAMVPVGTTQPVAAIGAYWAERHRASERELLLLQALAASAAVALVNQVARAEAEQAWRIADEANRAKDEFLAMLGHELRNPLAPIVTALQLMRLRGDGRAQREHDIIDRQVKHLTRLVDDLLDISRVARGKVELSKRPLQLSDVVIRAVELASPLLELRGQRLEVDVPRRGLMIHGDETRLAQVIANLLSNAAKYTDPAGTIEMAALREGNEVVLRVRDSGIGITAELLPRIFNLFVQGAQSSERRQGGLGLGLTLVRSLVELHGGQVSAHSEGIGSGSEFVVRLPALSLELVQDEPRGERPPLVIAGGAASGDCVLVVDDNVDAAELLADLLRSVGHDVLVAHDGPRALELVASRRPDVCVLDIGLPVMDGYELAERLRERFGDRTRLIALTGYGQDHDKRRAFAAGFDQHMVKPVEPDVLLRALKSVPPRGAVG